MNQITTITTKGQVTIPVYFRELLKIKSGQKIEFAANKKANELMLKPVKDFSSYKGFIKSSKKFSKKAARKAYIKDVVAGKI